MDTTFGGSERSTRRGAQYLLESIELQTAILVRNLEMVQRRSDFYTEVDRAGYLLLRTLTGSGPADIGTLSELLGLDPSTVGRQINAIQAAGLVEKKPDPHDLRRVIVSATPSGEQALAAVRQRRLEGTARILAGWSAEDLATVATVFDRYNRAIAQHYLGIPTATSAQSGQTGQPDRTADAVAEDLGHSTTPRRRGKTD